MQVKNSWQQASREIIRRLASGEVSVLTVDVFDTLLLRRSNPAFVIRSTCEHVSKRLGLSVEAVEIARSRSWQMETAQSISLGFDADARVVSHFQSWIRLLVGDHHSDSEIEILAASFLNVELDIEEACLKGNRLMIDVLRAARSHGVRTVAISDMYLGSSEVRSLLARLGFGDLLDTVVTSGDVLLQKKTGRLFAHCLRDGGEIFRSLPRDLSRVLHVGDDAVADGIMAERNGIESFVVYDHKFMWHRSLEHNAWQLPRAFSVANAVTYDAGRRNLPQHLGLTRFGPIYAGFIHAVAHQAVVDGVGSVWFMAREGWLLGELYQQAVDFGLGDRRIPWGYLYVSRLATMRAQLTTFGDHEIRSIASNTADRSFAKLLAPLRLSSPSVEEVLSKAGLKPSDATTPDDLARLLSDPGFIQIVTEIGSRERAAFRKYLEATGFPKSGRVAVVDVGWGGQIQENLCRALKLIGSEVEVIGYYMGTDHRAEDRRAAGIVMKSLVTDSERSTGNGVGAFSFVQGLELATRSPHGSVMGYDLDTGLPMLAAETDPGRVSEMSDDPDIASIQEGVLEFGRKYFDLAAQGALDVGESVYLAQNVIDLLSLAPSKIHADALLKFNNVANLGMEEGLLLGGKASILRPRRLISILRSTLWQEGTISSALPVVGPLAFVCYRRWKGRIIWTTATTRDVHAQVVAPAADPVFHVGVVQDVLTLDIPSRRRSAAARAPSHKIAVPANILGLSDLLALKIIKKAFRSNDRWTFNGVIKGHLKGVARFVYKYPPLDLLKRKLLHK